MLAAAKVRLPDRETKSRSGPALFLPGRPRPEDAEEHNKITSIEAALCPPLQKAQGRGTRHWAG
jgi:hypothetical protein